MRLRKWLFALLSQARPPRRRNRLHRNSMLELLEDRTLLSTFTVNSFADSVDADPDDGVGMDADSRTTLRAAVMQARILPGSHTIIVPAGTFYLQLESPVGDDGEPIDSQSTGDLDIFGNVTIQGAGPGETIIDAYRIDRAFTIWPGSDVSISDLTIRNGQVGAADRMGSGGGIWSDHAQLTLSNIEIRDNKARGERTDDEEDTLYAIGGGILISGGSATIKETSIHGNAAPFGAGIHVRDNATIEIIDSQIYDNQSDGSGGGLMIVNSWGTISSTLLSENHAGSSTGIGNGGAIASVNSRLSITDSEISANQTQGQGQEYDLVSYGGGIVILGGEATIISTTVSNNTAPMVGGVFVGEVATVEIHNSHIVDNVATAFGGGGIEVRERATLELMQSVVDGNTAETSGGGIQNWDGNLTVTDSVITDNRAKSGRGGGIYNLEGTTVLRQTIVSENEAENGGGLANSGHGELHVSGTAVFSNTAWESAGGLANNSADVTLTNVTISGNTALESAGGIKNNSGTLTAWNTTITENTAPRAGGVSTAGGFARFGNSIIGGNVITSMKRNVEGTFTSLGNNLVGVGDWRNYSWQSYSYLDATGFENNDNVYSLRNNAAPPDLFLGPLQDNGGGVPTHALLPGSPAINSGTADGAPALDQRNIRRKDIPDVGAFEVSVRQARDGVVRIRAEHDGTSTTRDGIPDTFSLRRHGDVLEVGINDTLQLIDFADLEQLVFAGSSDSDSLTVTLSNSEPLPSFEILFDAQSGSAPDHLELLGGTFNAVRFDLVDPDDGTVTVGDLAGTIHFPGVETISDSISADDRIFLLGNAADRIELADAEATGRSRLLNVRTGQEFIFVPPTRRLVVHGGSGNDVIDVAAFDETFDAHVVIHGGHGDDRLDAAGASISVHLNGGSGQDWLTGSRHDDLLTGGAGGDVLKGLDGNDVLRGQGSSHDILTGGRGDDTLDGGIGTDQIVEAGDNDFTLTDSLLTGLGRDTLLNIELAYLTGGPGDNLINAETFNHRVVANGRGGDDTLLGGNGHDILYGGGGSDLVDGGNGNDVVRGQGGRLDIVIGGAGDDKVFGDDGVDSLFGSEGNDRLVGGQGDDVLDGGPGNDQLWERGDFDFVLSDETLTGSGYDTLIRIESARLRGGNSNNILDAHQFSGRTTLIGMNGNDTILGGSSADLIDGRAGDDSLSGALGNDTINGGNGNDTLWGSGGNDRLRGNTGHDVIHGESGRDSLWGFDGNDTLVGGSGNDTLDGGAGDDGLSGSSGHDLLLGGAGNDRIHGGDGDDRILAGSGRDMVNGGSGNDRILGQGGRDTLSGGAGEDSIVDANRDIDESFEFAEDWIGLL